MISAISFSQIGSSLYDEEGAAIVPKIMETAKAKGVTIHLPTDFVCGSKFSNDAETTLGNLKDGVPVGYMVHTSLLNLKTFFHELTKINYL